ncbi:MAG: hypothetical protein JKY95_20320 [Planctomycetaceae bacterium]|nr:hypothetical protein [Planctomycetaceae bacterium]
MSGIRKLLLGGAICCLIISLVIPVTSSNGLNSNSEVSAAGPFFRNPFKKEKSSAKKSTTAKKRTVKSDSRTSDASDGNSKSSVMQKLQNEYEKSDQPSSKNATSNSKQSKKSSSQKSKASTQRDKKGNIFSRAYDKVLGNSKFESMPRGKATYAAERTPNANFIHGKGSKKVVSGESKSTKQIGQADIIIPPQPQPNFLPGLDMTDIEAIKPAITEGLKPLATNDPFPLPPLPDEIGSLSTSVSQSDTADAIQKLEPKATGLEVPLPGDFLIKFVPVETEPVPEKLTENAEQRVSEPTAEMIEQRAEAFVEPAPQVQFVEKPPVLNKHGLPPAPSAVDTAPVSSRTSVVKRRFASTNSKGWHSRIVKSQRQEPNTLNIPDDIRPAALPNPAVVHKEDTADKYRRISERGDRAGFKGFCPVVLREQLELVDASPEYRVEHEGTVYYLSTADAMAQFEEAPERYAPAKGGIDLVKFTNQGVEEPGSLDFAVWYQDQLYLFSSQERMDQFKSESDAFIPNE